MENPHFTAEKTHYFHGPFSIVCLAQQGVQSGKKRPHWPTFYQVLPRKIRVINLFIQLDMFHGQAADSPKYTWLISSEICFVGTVNTILLHRHLNVNGLTSHMTMLYTQQCRAYQRESPGLWWYIGFADAAICHNSWSRYKWDSEVARVDTQTGNSWLSA